MNCLKQRGTQLTRSNWRYDWMLCLDPPQSNGWQLVCMAGLSFTRCSYLAGQRLPVWSQIQANGIARYPTRYQSRNQDSLQSLRRGYQLPPPLSPPDEPPALSRSLPVPESRGPRSCCGGLTAGKSLSLPAGRWPSPFSESWQVHSPPQDRRLHPERRHRCRSRLLRERALRRRCQSRLRTLRSLSLQSAQLPSLTRVRKGELELLPSPGG